MDVDELLEVPSSKTRTIHGAVESGDLTTVKELLFDGASVHETDEAGCTPLHLALRKNDSPMAIVLLKWGSHISKPDKSGVKPFDLLIGLTDLQKQAVEGCFESISPEKDQPELLLNLTCLAHLAASAETRDYVISQFSTNKVVDRFVSVTASNSKPVMTQIAAILESVLVNEPEIAGAFKAGALTLLNKVLEFEYNPTFEKTRHLLLKIIKLPGDYPSKVAKVCGKWISCHLIRLYGDLDVLENEINLLDISHALSSSAPFQAHLIAGNAVGRLVQLATCSRMNIAEYSMGILAYLSENESSHEQFAACDDLVKSLKPIVLGSAKYPKRMCQNALQILVLLHLDQEITLEDQLTAPWLFDFNVEDEVELSTQGPDKFPKAASFLGMVHFLIYSPDISAEFIEMLVFTHRLMFSSIILLRILRYCYLKGVPIAETDPENTIVDDILSHYSLAEALVPQTEKTASILLQISKNLNQESSSIQKRVISFLLVWLDKSPDHFENSAVNKLAQDFMAEALAITPSHPLLLKLQNSLTRALLEIVKPRAPTKTQFCNHSEIYLRARDAVINGQLPLSEDEAITLAAIFLRVELIGNKVYRNETGDKLLIVAKSMLAQFFRGNPNETLKTLQTATRVRDIYLRDFFEMSDREAKHSFIDVCKSLDTYGYLFFPVKQQSLQEMKIFPRKLGISDDFVVVVDQDTNRVLKKWPVERIRNCKSTTDFLLLRISSEEGAAHFNTEDAPYIAKLVKKAMKRLGGGKGFKLDLKINRGCPPDPLTNDIAHPVGDAVLEAIKSMAAASASIAGGSAFASSTLTAMDALSFVGELARQLTLLEYDLFRGVTVTGLLDYVITKKKSAGAESAREIIQHFNKVSDWISSEIVKEVDDDKRVFLLKQFIFLGKTLLENNNLNGTMEVWSGLNSTPVRKLQATWNRLSPEDQATVKHFENLLSPRSNYADYRKYVAVLDPPSMPYFGFTLTDFTFVSDGNTDCGSFGFHNLAKRRKQHEVLQNFLKHKEREFVFLPVAALQTYITQLEPLSEDERYSLAVALANRPATSS